MAALIKSVNCGLLCIILIGIPAIAGTRFGSLQVSSIPTTQRLMLWGLSLVAAANAIAALGGVKDRKSRRLCRYWAMGFIGLLSLEVALAHGYLDFQWLKQSLLWLQERF
jgi:hypothetical protein